MLEKETVKELRIMYSDFIDDKKQTRTIARGSITGGSSSNTGGCASIERVARMGQARTKACPEATAAVRQLA